MAWINLSQTVFPVGSVYMSTLSISPASTIGGTWSKQENGCLACAGTPGYASAGSNGGSSIITEEQMPPHTHEQYVTANAAPGSAIRMDYSGDAGASGAARYPQGAATGVVGGGRILSSALLRLRLYSNRLAAFIEVM